MTRLLALLLVLPLAAACASDQERYCEAVEEHQAELTEIVGQGGGAALLDALDIYRDLQDDAPRDIEDEWRQVVGALEGLDEALADAGADPATYDPEDPPAEVSPQEREAIARAADEVGSVETQEALRGLEQQARDVCQTPLSL
jgi:hypothetical protein